MERLRFGPYLLDPEAGELTREGLPVRLPLQPFRALHHLALRAGEVVSREELKEVVWGSEVSVDFETGLNTLVRQIRRSLGDEAATPVYLETLPKRGYRFLARVEREPRPPVRQEGAMPAAAPGEKPAGGESRARSLARTGAVRVLAALLVLAAAAAILASTRARPEASRTQVVVVLPLANLTGDPASDYLAEGLTEDVIGRLSTCDPARISVIARTSAMAYRGSTKTVARIAKELGATLVLEGSLRSSPRGLRVAARLVRASDQTPLFSDTFENAGGGTRAAGWYGDSREARDAVSPEEELARRIARAAAVPFRENAGANAAEGRDLVLRARYLLNHRDAASVESAVSLFEEAARQGPANAAAHAGLAQALLSRGELLSSASDLAAAREAARRALQLAPANGAAWAVIAILRLHVDWDAAGAEQAWRRSLAADPGRAESHHARAACLATLRRHEEALAEVRTALRLDPLNPSVTADVGWHSHLARRYDQAAEEFRRTLELPGLEDWMFEWTIQNDLARRRPGEAMPVLRALLERHDASEPLAALRTTTPEAALMRHLRSRVDELSRREVQRPEAALGLAMSLALLGEREDALAAFERSVAARVFWLPPIAAAAPALDPLRKDPRFEALLARLNLSNGPLPGEGRAPEARSARLTNNPR